MFAFYSAVADELKFNRCRLGLVDNTYLWLLSSSGCFLPTVPLLPRTGFLTVVEEHEPGTRKCFTVTDMQKDPLYSGHPMVAQRPYARYFAGVPVVSAFNEHCMGAVAVLDFVVRDPLTEHQEDIMHQLAEDVMVILQEDVVQCLEEPNGKNPVLPAVWIDVSTPSWNITKLNSAWGKLTGLSEASTLAHGGLLDIFMPETENELAALKNAVETTAGGGPLPDHNSAVRGILSPVELQGRSLQFIVSFRPSEQSIIDSSNDQGIRKIWIMEIHARFERTVYTPSNSIGSGSELPSVGSMALSSVHGSGAQALPGTPSSSSHGSAAKTPTETTPRASFKFTRSSGETSERIFSGPTIQAPPRFYALELGKLLGHGSFGTVYAGLLGNVPVAVKVIEAPVGLEWENKQWDARFEASIAMDMMHENVVRTIDWCHHEDNVSGRVWIIQELCGMGSLSEAIDKGMLLKKNNVKGHRVPDLRSVLETAVEIARGMAYLHSRDVLHADLSSNNVLLVSADNYRGFTAKVTDFGMSRFSARDQATRTFGTASHM